MEVRFCIQDPTHPGTTYLYEAIIAAVVGADAWRGVYAFASRDGVDHLVEDQVVHDLMRRGGAVDLLVGIDAVTNRPTLERLRELGQRHAQFRPKVFWNGATGLFHPKISDFTYECGRRTLIVGSGNLTPGGLRTNFEGYTIISVDDADELDVSAFDEFLERHAEQIREIDDEALERAARNLVRATTGARRGTVVIPRRPARPVAPRGRPEPHVEFDRVLIALMPEAGGRWAQGHFNADVVRDYFRITDRQNQRAYLTHVMPDGARAQVEVRRCVYSERNKNHKIEIGAARGRAYPAQAPPLLVFRERQLRIFDYMLLMPGENGYGPLDHLVQTRPTVGRGFRRVYARMDDLAAAWPDCPLLNSEQVEEQEI